MVEGKVPRLRDGGYPPTKVVYIQSQSLDENIRGKKLKEKEEEELQESELQRNTKFI